MTDEPNKTHTPDPDLDLGWDIDEDAAQENARPTMAPPFDLATYAKESMAPSSAGRDPLPTLPGTTGPPPPEARRPDAASGVPSEVDTEVSLPPPPPLPSKQAPPPRRVGPIVPRPSQLPPRPEYPTPFAVPSPFAPADREGPVAFSSVITPVPPASEPPSRKATPREVQRAEAARAKEAAPKSGPQSAPGWPREPRTDSVLAMANLRAPLQTPPPRVPAVTPPLAVTPKAREAVAPAVSDPIVEMQERFALGDYSGALVMAESMLDENPTHTEAREYADSCRAVLQQMYTARIGPLERIPVVDVAHDQLRWLSIDHRTGFILSLVDGISSLEMILDVCGMPPLDALRMLFELVQQRIISIRE